MTMVYRNVASTNTSRLEAHAGFFRLLMNGDFQSLFTATFRQKFDLIVKPKHVRTRDCTIHNNKIGEDVPGFEHAFVPNSPFRNVMEEAFKVS